MAPRIVHTIPLVPPAPASSRLLFRRRHRLPLDRDYQAAFGAKVRKSSGPFTIFARPNGLPHPRLGLSVGKRIGNAVARNAVKRRIREAFRLNLPALIADAEPGNLDYVVTVRPHEPLDFADYQRHFLAAADALAREWQRRHRRTAEADQQ